MVSFITNWNQEEQFYKNYYGTIAKELGDIDLTNELFFLLIMRIIASYILK